MTQPAPPDYGQALIAAAALQAAVAAPGPVDRVGQLVNTMAASIDVIRDRVTGRVQQRYRQVNPYRGDEVQAFIADAARQMRSAQTAVATSVAGAQRAELRAMGLSVPSIRPSNPIDVRGPAATLHDDGTFDVVRPDELTITVPDATPRTDDADPSDEPPDVEIHIADEDYTTEGIFNRPARTYRYERSIGTSEVEAEQKALDRIAGLVDDNLMLAQRLAEHESLAQAADLDNRVIGYRRVIHPELARGGSCGMCIAAADRVYKIRELKAIHKRCHCTITAVTDDFDPGDELNKADLEALYGDAKGTSRSALKRTRYRVDAHGELGAVLVPRRRQKTSATGS
ncbi:hypothetical protein KXR83_05740 [Williamsia muralis]|uniref:hypothetical protein n=1 Tax=Williamsia marianensis TaxID=85044 RepID=UPI003F145193